MDEYDIQSIVCLRKASIPQLCYCLKFISHVLCVSIKTIHVSQSLITNFILYGLP